MPDEPIRVEPAPAADLQDRVPRDCPGAREIGFDCPERYNASRLLFDNLERGLAAKTAVLCPRGDMTYAALCARAARIGHVLAALELGRGERVLLFMDDHGDHLAAFFGAVRAGFVPVLVNTLSPGDLIDFYLEDAGARAVICEGAYAGRFEAAARAGIARVVAGGEGPDGLDHLARGHPDTLPEADTHRDDMAFWMYSSGSTGRPKGVVHLQHDPLYTAEAYARRVLGLAGGDVCFSVPKLFFAYGFGNSATFPLAVGGATVLLPERPEPARVFDTVARYRPTRFFALPTLYTALIKHPAAATADFSSVRTCISAAEILSGEIFEAWRRRFGHEILEELGSTEVLHIYLSNRPHARKLGSAGRRVPGYEIELTDESGAPVARGQEGVMWVRGDSNAPCYWNRPEKTAETMRDGWIRTGDRFVEDAEGFYFFKGRADDLVKISGQWVYPLEVELCLAEHPDVRECAVLALALPDGRWTLKAYVALEPGAATDAATTKALQDFVKGRLLPYKYPRRVEYVGALPKTGTGKIDRAALKARPL